MYNYCYLEPVTPLSMGALLGRTDHTRSIQEVIEFAGFLANNNIMTTTDEDLGRKSFQKNGASK